MGRLWVQHAPESAAIVRRTVCSALAQAGVCNDDALDGALISSELMGNSVRHANALPSGHLLVSWQIDHDCYTVAVTDGGGSHEIAAGNADIWDNAGRGLSIVDRVASDWGVVTAEDGSCTVWAKRHYTRAGLQITAEQTCCAS